VSGLADWEVELLLAHYEEGDLVEIRKGEELHRGRLVKRTMVNRRTLNRRESLGLSSGAALTYYLSYGYTIELIARALPTEPGFYVFGETGLAILNKSGEWFAAHERGRPIEDPASFFGKRVPRRLIEATS
jgi:hypothetical protein